MKWAINLLGLVGAIIGIAAIFSTWLGAHAWLAGDVSWNLIGVLNDAPAYGTAWYAALFFIIGTLVAFLSPAGGLLQVWGVLNWWAYYLDLSGEMPSRMASYLGLASAIIVLASMARPYGPGLMKGPMTIKNRLLTFSKMPARFEGHCIHCGGALKEGNTFCASCGRAIASETGPTKNGEYCATCGKAITPEDQFCKSCGRRL